MANSDHIEILKKGRVAISEWQEANPNTKLDLRGADLRRIDLVRSTLENADFSGANLEWADFRWADLMNVNFSDAILSRADFHKADMQKSVLKMAVLFHTNLEDSNLRGAKLDNALFGHTRILNSDLAGSTGLFSIKHKSPSTLDKETIQKSGPLPKVFLQGCGVNENAINSILQESSNSQPIDLHQQGEYYSVFISFSSIDIDFAQKLHLDLQECGVRCWFAPEDMKIGDEILENLHEEIRTHEKLLLVLSSSSVNSSWVKDEVNKGFSEERDRQRPIIFPISLDDAVMTTEKTWAQKIRDNRHIGNFREWKNTEAYKISFKRLLRDLKNTV